MLATKLRKRIAKTDTCWLWSGYIHKRTGYGRLGQSLAHRLVYETLVGEIPPGLELDHLCRVRHCVNPKHLEPVTSAENTRRGAAALTECKHGHLMSNINTYVAPTGRRQCRVCNKLAVRLYKLRLKEMP